MSKFGRIIITFCIILAVFPGIARAQGDISASSAVEIEFPMAMTFNLTAESSVDITRIVLRYKVNMIATAKVTSLVLLEFDPAPSVQASWKWDMRKSGGLPPGTEVQYSWEIEDAAGSDLETGWELVRYDDDNYSWSSVKEDKLTLFWYRGSQAWARHLMDAAQQALERLAGDTGAYLEHPVEIYIYSSSREMRDAMVNPQEWVGGVSFNQHGIVMIGVAPEDQAWGMRAMTHELAHLVTYQMTFNPYTDIPTWLTEGLSVYAEGDLEPSFSSALNKAMSEDNLISVQTLSSNFPASREEAVLSYAESYSLVEFLIEDYGRDKMLQMLRIFKEGSTYNGALAEVYGFDMAGLDDLWRDSLGLAPRPALPSPSPSDAVSPSPSPSEGLFECQPVSSEAKHNGYALFGLVGLISLPGILEAVRIKNGRGKK